MTRMVFARILAAAVLLPGSLLWMSAASPAFGACNLQRVGSVDVRMGGDGAVLVPVRVNGHGAWMILGMANGVPVVWRSAAERLGLKFKRQFDADMHVRGVKVTEKTVVDSLVIGSVNFTKWDLYVDPTADPRYQIEGQPLLGGLTSRFMNAVDLELDLGHGKLNLFKPTTGCGGRQVYWGGVVTAVDLYVDPTGLLLFPMEIDGRRVEASLNTQGGTSNISEAVTKQYFGFDHESEGITKETDPQGRETASYRAMGLTAKGLAIKNAKIRLVEDLKRDCEPTSSERNSEAIGFSQCWGRAPLSLGTDLLRKLRIYIAPRESKIYFTRAAPDPDAGSDPNGGGPDVPAAGAAAGQPAAVPGAALPAAAAASPDAPPAAH
jgi:hypothetical protein